MHIYIYIYTYVCIQYKLWRALDFYLDREKSSILRICFLFRPPGSKSIYIYICIYRVHPIYIYIYIYIIYIYQGGGRITYEFFCVFQTFGRRTSRPELARESRSPPFTVAEYIYLYIYIYIYIKIAAVLLTFF